MAKNYMQDVANILGVELGEEFKLDGRKTKYKFTENGLYFYAPDGWWQCSNVMLPKILKGELEIVKLPWKPKVGDVYYRPRDYHTAFSEAVTDFWRDTVNDFALKEAGMIFRTEEECKAALPELRKKYLGGGCNETDD